MKYLTCLLLWIAFLCVWIFLVFEYTSISWILFFIAFPVFIIILDRIQPF